MSARIFIAITVFSILGFVLSYLWVRAFGRLYDRLWRRQWVRRMVWGVPILWLVSTLSYLALRFLGSPPLIMKGLTGIRGIIGGLIVVTLPFMALGLLLRLWAQGRATAPEPPEASPAAEPAAQADVPEASGLVDAQGRPLSGRRRFLLHTASAMPAVGLAVAGKGAAGGLAAAQVVRMEMTFPRLPDALDGLTILHYTDMHLGTFIDLNEVQALATAGAAHRPDVVVLTGDISDDLDRLLPALRMFENIAPKHGVFASIGNHEYFRGIKKTLVTYAKSDVPLLIEKGHRLKIDNAELYIAGADDPRFLRGDNFDFMNRTVNNSLDGAPSEAFRLLLSHRPEGFVPAAQNGFHLTLSGHTHGAQLGFNGRSLLEDFMPDRYLWGAYASGESRLYTSSGVGHWFPFRLGCPREIPMIVLRKGPAGGEVKKVQLA